MSQQQTPLTAEVIFEMFRQAAEETKEIKRQAAEETEKLKRMFQETDRKIQEVARLSKETEKKISELGSRVGEIVENMVGSDIVRQFQALGIAIKSHSRYKNFWNKGNK